MTEKTPVSREEIYDFIHREIDTIPHLEALLLIWKSSPRQWTVDEVAKELYVSEGTSQNVLQDLHRSGLLAGDSGLYRYASASIKRDQVIQALDATYRRELIPISKLIHAKGTAAMRDFAEAFRFTKNKD